MKIVIAPDSFKDALPALQVCEAIRRGVFQALPSAEVVICPLADGGEGTAEVLAWHLGGELVWVEEVDDPLFRTIESAFFLFQKNGGKKIAFVEMARASGLQLLPFEERNPLKTSTFGTGQLVLETLRRGANEIYMAIGGSATNDAGMGMAAALGWRFLDKNFVELWPVGENLKHVEVVVQPKWNSFDEEINMSKTKFTVLCDVTNPLFGPSGAAYVFAPQKGADSEAVVHLDEGLRHFSKIIEKELGIDFSQKTGAGAAGGLGFGAMAFLNAQVQSGAEAIMELVDFEGVVKDANLIITGEGRLDGQTSQGKLIATVSKKAKQVNVPVVALCGTVETSEEEIERLGLRCAVPLKRPGETLSSSLERTAAALESESYKVLKSLKL